MFGKILRSWLAVIFAIAILAGCGQSVQNSGESSQTSAGSLSENSAQATPVKTRDVGGLPLPLSTTGEVIRVMMPEVEVDDKSWTRDSFPILEELEKRTGVKLKIDTSYMESYSNLINTRLASGTDLPDLLVMGGADLTKMGSDGTILELNDLIKQNAPNTNRLFEKYPDIRRTITGPDGTIWGFPGRVAPADAQYSCLVYGYRLDWLNKLGIAEPQTITDWYNMLIAFRDGDPNGNGKQDEVPLICWAPNKINGFSLAYGMSPWSNWFSQVKGKIAFDWTSAATGPKAKEWIAEMARWYKEKLIDQAILVDHYDKAVAMLVTGMAGAELEWSGAFGAMTTQMKTEYPDAYWALSAPPEGPYGDRAYENYPMTNGERWMLTKSCKNPALVIQWLDYRFASEEGQLLANYGVEGDTYKMVDGKPQFIESAVKEKHYKDPSALMASKGMSRLPSFVPPDAERQLSSMTMSQDSIDRLASYSGYFKTMFPFVPATKEESGAMTNKLSDINTYLNEMICKFVTGSEPLSNYDKFIEKLNSMGIDDIVKIKQAQYDRYMKN